MPLYNRRVRYRALARYVASGSADGAAHVVAFRPVAESSVGHHRICKPLYAHVYQATCSTNGSQIVCQPSELPKQQNG